MKNIFYQDLKSAIKKTANFLGKNLNEEELNSLKGHLSFESMKKNPSVNRDKVAEKINESKIFGENYQAEGNFMRKGESGYWKTTMSQEMIKKFDDWTSDHLKDHYNLKDEFP